LYILSFIEKKTVYDKKKKKGTMLTVSLLCELGHDTVWHSQPRLSQGMSAGNLCMAASILLSGNTFQRIKEMDGHR